MKKSGRRGGRKAPREIDGMTVDGLAVF